MSIPPAIPEESRVSAAPTALGVVVEGFSALPGWADVWAAGPPGLEARATKIRALWMTAKRMSWSACFEQISKSALYQGTTSVVPKRGSRTRAFSPCGAISLSVRLRAAFGSSTCEEDY